MDAIQEHEQKMLDAFGAVLRAEDRVFTVKKRQADAEAAFALERGEAETSLRLAWDEVQKLMGGTGEPEVTLPGTVTDYKIGWSKPPERVKTIADAVPDEFVKTERVPKLKEIGDHLKELRSKGADLPNWASLERGEPKLGWKAVKRINKE